MTTPPDRRPRADQELVLALASAWSRVQRRVDAGLGHIKGITLAEYRLLRAIADAPHGRLSRVDLADAVGLTPSGVTRALRPLEKLGFVATERGDRDARQALASLTPAGEELVADASGVIDDIAAQVMERVPELDDNRALLVGVLAALAG